ncbi:MAG TPA: hypothetical protein VFO85_18965, partial [Vicinamibacteria bacterium]|nr:hypothetical protein [Vicinamibacteria bacterium]
MIPRPPLARALLAVLAAAALAVTAASQVSVPVTLEMGSPFLSGRFTRDLHAPEPGFRWTGETGRVRLPAPGPARDVGVEVTLSAWRPRGQPLPLAVLDAAGARAIVQTTPRPQTVRLEGRSRGAWAGEVELALAAPALGPTPSDARRLGLRLHRVRL